MEACAYEQIVELIGDRWSLLLIGVLLSGPHRTTELATVLSPISTRTLAERLKRLEAAGVLTRHAYAEAPPRVEYQLTSRGHELRTIITAFRTAASRWNQPSRDASDRPDVVVVDAPAIEPRIAEPSIRRIDAVDVTLL